MNELPTWIQVLIMFGVPAAACTLLYVLAVFALALVNDWRKNQW